MSADGLRKFKLEAGEDIHEEFEKYIRSLEGTEKSNQEVMALFIRNKGYDVSAEDFEELFSDKEELNEDDLELVTGGFGLNERWVRRMTGSFAALIAATQLGTAMPVFASTTINDSAYVQEIGEAAAAYDGTFEETVGAAEAEEELTEAAEAAEVEEELTEAAEAEEKPAEAAEVLEGLDSEQDPANVGLSAQAEETYKQISGEVTNFAKDKAKEYAKKGITALCGMVPEGAFVEPVFQKLLDYVMSGGEQGPNQLTLIAEQVSELQKQMKDEAESIKKQISGVAAMSQYGHYLDLMSVSCDKVLMNLNAYATSDLPENDKMVLMASLLTGLNSDRTDNLFSYILMESAVFNGTSGISLDGRDIFRVAYDMSVPNAMFSGEAVDLSQSYIKESVDHFTKAYAIAMTCLEAYLSVFDFSEEDVQNLRAESKQEYISLCKIPGTIYNAINLLNERIYGENGALEHYTNYRETYRYTFINQGRDNIKLSPDVILSSHLADADYDVIDSKLQNQPVNTEQARAIVRHATEDLKMTTYDYLRTVAHFNMPVMAATKKIYLPGRQGMDMEEHHHRWKTTRNAYYTAFDTMSKTGAETRVHFYGGCYKKDYGGGRPIIFQLANNNP